MVAGNLLCVCVLVCLASVLAVKETAGAYSVGTGLYDITGPAAEIGMMVRQPFIFFFWIILYKLL